MSGMIFLYTLTLGALHGIFFFFFFLRARVCRPLLRLCRPFMIFEGCLDSNPEYCRSKLARYRLRWHGWHGIFTVVATGATSSENPTAWIPKKDLRCVSRRLPYYCHMVSQIIQFSFYLQFYETKIEKKSRRAG
jgi:hypothetical protein